MRTAVPLTPTTSQKFDRYIPSRAATDLETSAFEIEAATSPASYDENFGASPAKEAYKKRLAAELFRGEPPGPSNKLLHFHRQQQTSSSPPAAAAAASTSTESLRMLYTHNRQQHASGRSAGRHVPNHPERILDAPELIDDYYLNLIDWNAEGILGVALGDSVYMWNARSGSIQQLMSTGRPSAASDASDGHVTSIAWAPRGASQMAVGTSDGKVLLFDATKCQLVRAFDDPGHCGRVGVLAWNGARLSSGARTGRIAHRDPRAARSTLATHRGHTQEVCGLKWAPSGAMLASGGNDNLLNIWDERVLAPPFGSLGTSHPAPLHALRQHQAAVKALAWCPWQRSLLASGGGTADRTIRFWHLGTGASCPLVNAVDTHSQVCALQWSAHERELVSSHGYSHNQIILWKYPSMVKVAELTGHTSRVLHMAQSPDGTTICSAAADETLRFWKILGKGSDVRRGESDSPLGASAWRGPSPSGWTVR